MCSRGNRVARIGNAHAIVDVPRIMNSAATCSGRSYAASRTPPTAQLDRLAGCESCCSTRKVVSRARGAFGIKQLPKLLWEIKAEIKRTESSQSAQSLTF